MGIADRDYYREDGRWHFPFARAQVTVFLVITYLILFVAQSATMPKRPGFGEPNPLGITNLLELNTDSVLNGEVWRVLSYAAVHQPDNVIHVLFTIVFLLWIGRQVEDLYGNKEFLALFLATTLLGGLTYTVISAISHQSIGVLRGPSGAVTALFVLYALHYPGKTISLFFVLPVPIWVIVILYGLYDITSLGSNPANAGVVAVHLASASFAFVYHRYSLRVLNWIPSPRTKQTRLRRPKTKLKIFQEQLEPEPATAHVGSAIGSSSSSPSSGIDEHLEAKLDEVLEKVNKSGKASLTESEQQVLLKASEFFKKRRQSN